jgi:PAS domain S-box-containing protein
MPRERERDGATLGLEEVLGLELDIAEHHETDLRRRSRGGEAPALLLNEALTELRGLTRSLRAVRQEIRKRTEQMRRLEQDVERERDRYHELLLTSPVAFITTDAQASIRDANRAAESLFGQPKEHLVARCMTDFMPRGDLVTFETHLRAALAAPETRTQWEGSLGSEHPLSEPIGLSVTIARDRNGRVDHLRWCIVRLRDRKRAELSERAYVREKAARMEAERQAFRFRLISRLERALAEAQAPHLAVLERVLVPALADRCLLLDESDVERAFGRTVARLAASGRAVFVPHVDVRALPPQPGSSDRQMEATAFAIFAPVDAPDAAQDVLALLGWGQRHPFDSDDVLLAELITARLSARASPPALRSDASVLR